LSVVGIIKCLNGFIQIFYAFLKRAKAKDLLAASATTTTMLAASTASLATTSSATMMSHLIYFVITFIKKKICLNV
jgi:uncharacterized membrane protein HdeD (DUF308 family)